MKSESQDFFDTKLKPQEPNFHELLPVKLKPIALSFCHQNR
jgi:hypothetical protein